MLRRVVLLIALLAISAGAGWYLLRPLRYPAREPAAHVAATASATAEPSIEETSAATETPAPTETPGAAASIAPSPSTEVSGPRLALIVDDCGQWLDVERGFIALPVPLTMSVLPHVHGTAAIAQEAHDAGKGVMLHLPMDTLSGLNPGPGEVKTTMTDAEVTAQTEDDLAQVPLAAGVNNHEGSKGSADARVMKDVIAVLRQHGDLFFIDSRTNAASVGESVARDAGVPTASRDVFLDNKADVAYTEGQLREAIAIAKRNGSAIAIGHPRPTTLAAVKAMLPEFRDDGVQLVLAQPLTH